MERNSDVELLNLIRSTENIIKRNRAGSGIPKGNGRIMHAISENDGLSQAELASLMEIRPQSLTRTLTELERQGYITRKRSAADGRAMSVFITEKGRAYHDELRSAREMRAKRLFRMLSGAEKEELEGLLRRIISSNTGEEEGC